MTANSPTSFLVISVGGAIVFWDDFDDGTNGDSEILIENSYFADNYTYGDDGGAVRFYLYDSDSTLTIRDSEFFENYAEGNGGALSAEGGDAYAGQVYVIDSLFYGNDAYEDWGRSKFREPGFRCDLWVHVL